VVEAVQEKVMEVVLVVNAMVLILIVMGTCMWGELQELKGGTHYCLFVHLQYYED